MNIVSNIIHKIDDSKIRKYFADNDVKVIGGADGPTAIYVTKKTNTFALGFGLGTIFGLVVAIVAMAKHMSGNGKD